MASNKERIEALEAGLDGVQDGMQRLELSVTDKLHRLEETINKLSEENDGGRLVFSSKMAKLEFLRDSRDDPTKWLNRVAQFFEFQGIVDNQKVSLASFHPEGEANQWWQWLHRAYREEGRLVTLKSFEKELWACFGPTEGEDFDEALPKVRQKALVGSFMRGLRSEISEAIRMFKPKTLKEAEGVEAAAYKLKLPDDVRLHPAFHVSLLWKKLGDGFMTSTTLLPISNKGTLVIEPEAILDTHWVKRGAKFSEESLVKWRILTIEDAT
ncbi:hypothetical protein Pint_21564 [Pistacia integerrima]|uniref:Uncharacterized protein n=1 Tax=Pistacia integerrima TaxID=434235 RepID=A0ACC0XEP1_9ROSI|nr:hypothetical protein Pint_21564 [Pistacia integerrima]